MNDYYCNLCGISSTGPIPHEAHLKSKTHKKHMMANFVLSTSNLRLEVAASLPNSKNNSRSTPAAGYNCDICGVSMSGLLNYNQHLEGIAHKKMLAKTTGTTILEISPVSTPKKKINNVAPELSISSINSDEFKNLYLKDVAMIESADDIKEALNDFFGGEENNS